jgi:Tol biopolymer transport system component
MAHSRSFGRFFLQIMVVLLLLCSVGLALASSLGRMTAPSPQIYFIPVLDGKPGMVMLDVGRSLFARRFWRSPIRTVSDWAWSPDGSQIAFRVTRNISVDIMAMDSGGDNLHWLTQDGRNNHAPSWSPDGQHIAFVSERDGNAEIYVMDADGQNQRRLTDSAATDDSPSWSPDSAAIFFHSRRDGDYEIYRMDFDGKNLQRLTVSPDRDVEPALSPDGQHIAFVSGRDGNYEVYVMDTDGAHPQRLTYTREFEFSPRWSPDGDQILFEAMTTGSDVLTYLMAADGSGLRRLTAIDMLLHNPLWHTP